MKKTRKQKKALSGAVTALILVIASVIIALVVVGFAFGLFGAFSTTPNIHLVSAYISKQGSTEYLYITVSNTGSANGEILGVIVQAGGSATSVPVSTSPVTVSAGQTTVFSVALSLSLTPGEQVTFQLVTNTGESVSGVATVLS